MSDSTNVLLVDREPNVLQAWADILKDEGYTVFTADTGEQAVQALRANPIDVVVADLEMPGVDGLDLPGTIRRVAADTSVVGVTARSSAESTIGAMSRGASDCLVKPIEPETLRSALADAVAKRRGDRANREPLDRLRYGNEQLKRLNAERERALEDTAQRLRQPLIDQLNWCELIMSDCEHSPHIVHLESISKLRSAANRMLADVQDLLDEEKIEERVRAVDDISVAAESASPPPVAGPPRSNGPLRSDARSDRAILLVEPSPILRDVLFGVLRQRFHVLSAADGWEALELTGAHPDLILTEVDLPRVDAASMIRQAQHILERVAVLVMYDAEDMSLVAPLRSLGVREALVKPFHVVDLLERLESLAESGGTPMTGSVLVLCPDPAGSCALYHVLDTRYRTHMAVSAEAAMEAADDHWDMLIIDVSAPDYSWEDMVAFFRRRHEAIKVLALTDSPSQAGAEALREAGVDSALLTPYSFDDLLSRVRNLLGVKTIDRRLLRSVFRKLA